MADQPETKQVNFTIVPEESTDSPRTYANFCSIAHTPFDFTLTFCEVMPLSDKEVKEAENQHVVRAPVRARVVVPVQFLPNLVAALQEHIDVLGTDMLIFRFGWSGMPDELVQANIRRFAETVKPRLRAPA